MRADVDGLWQRRFVLDHNPGLWRPRPKEVTDEQSASERNGKFEHVPKVYYLDREGLPSDLLFFSGTERPSL